MVTISTTALVFAQRQQEFVVLTPSAVGCYEPASTLPCGLNPIEVQESTRLH